MFYTYQSHSLQALADHFSAVFEPESSNPLVPPWIIVQNNEIKEWLSLKVAVQKGIAGNFKFIFPSEFLWALYRLGDDEIPQVLPSDLNAIHWALFDLFANDRELLKQIPYYDLNADSPNRRFQLCSQLADNFDQYQVYRPQIMNAWLDRRLVTKHKDEKWQASIWMKLNQRWKSESSTRDIPTRAGAFKELLDWLKDDSSFLKRLPKQLYIFGLSQTSKPFLEIISMLAKHCDVHFFTGNAESESGIELGEVTELMRDWEKPVTEQQILLQNILKEDGVAHELITLQSVLKRLPNLEVHSCHNKRREVQVLKDQLLHFLDHHPDCNLSQVLIMVPDADEYASLIESIFENDQSEPFLPVSRLSNQQRQSEEYALNTLLDLLSSSYKTSAMLQVLNLEPIKQKFSFSDDELDVLEEWILDNKIFRGLGREFNSDYSWQKALNQMVSGFAMEPEPLTVFKGLVPYNEIVSTEDMQLSARFSEFIHALVRTEASVRQPKTPVEWLNFTVQIVTAFLDHPNQESTSRIHKVISKLKEQAGYTDSNEQLPFQSIKSWLKAQFDTTSSSSGRFGQGVTVSSYIPYRSVPFRFIGVLGMNEGVFPRKAVRPEFDLIYANPQPGDRIQKEDDTYLFFETIVAAENHLHISYRGQDQRTDSKRLPSILVQQYLDELYEDWEKGISYHNLHPFNGNYFRREGDKFSYSGLNLELAKKLQGNGESHSKVFVDQSFNKPEPVDYDRNHISDIISFFTHPSKFILYNQLEINNYSSFNEITDRESFKLNNLERYYLDDFLFQKLLQGEEEQKIYEFTQAAALIPDQLEGEKSFLYEKEKILELLEEVNKHATGKEREVNISIQLGDKELYGMISGVYDDVLVSCRVGQRRAKHEVSHWLKHLLLLENDTDIRQSLFVSKHKKEGVQVLKINSNDIPNDLLPKLIEWYSGEKSMLNKTAFFPETSRVYAEKLKQKDEPEEALNEAYKKWFYHKKYNQYAESNDYFNSLMWRNLDPLAHDAFIQNALIFWNPFLEAVKEGES